MADVITALLERCEKPEADKRKLFERAIRQSANEARNACFSLNMPNCGAAAAVAEDAVLALIKPAAIATKGQSNE